MNKLLLPVILSTLLTFSYPIYPATSNIALLICEYVAANDKRRLRSYLKSNKLKIRKIFKGMKCNNLNLLSWSAKHNALDAGTFIINKLPKKTVRALESEIKELSPHLSIVIEKRLN